MEDKFTDEERTQYLNLLKEMILSARVMARTCEEPKMLHDLLDAAHNIPQLICEGTRDKRRYVLPTIKKYNEKYGGNFFRYIPNENVDEW